MRQLFITLIICAGILACGNPESANPSETQKKPETLQTAVADTGEKTFKKYCIACHGLTGDMEINGAKDFNLSKLTLEERILVITEGRNMMTPFKDILSPEEIKEVAAYTIRRFSSK